MCMSLYVDVYYLPFLLSFCCLYFYALPSLSTLQENPNPSTRIEARVEQNCIAGTP